MKFSIALAAGLAGLAVAAPSTNVGELHKRQATQNDLKSGTCKKVTLIFARASTEQGNMVREYDTASQVMIEADYNSRAEPWARLYAQA